MSHPFDVLFDRFDTAGAGFERRLRLVRPEQWGRPTPCSEWNVRQLVNHMTRGNLNYVRLVRGGDAEEFLRLRDVDALGADPLGAYVESARSCAAAFAEPGALERTLDYPLGSIPGRQALAVRITDTVVHTWDLARAISVDDRLDAELVAWVDENLESVYAGLVETPVSAETTHRFFAAPEGVPAGDVSRQERLLNRMGRRVADHLPGGGAGGGADAQLDGERHVLGAPPGQQ